MFPAMRADFSATKAGVRSFTLSALLSLFRCSFPRERRQKAGSKTERMERETWRKHERRTARRKGGNSKAEREGKRWVYEGEKCWILARLGDGQRKRDLHIQRERKRRDRETNGENYREGETEEEKRDSERQAKEKERARTGRETVRERGTRKEREGKRDSEMQEGERNPFEESEG